MQIQYYPILLLMICIITSASAQEANLGNWLVYRGKKQINTHWNWSQSVQYRSYNAISDFHQLLIRNAIGYSLSEKHNNISLGYDYLLDQSYINLEEKKSPQAEHRLYQQFLTQQQFGRFKNQHRYRLEERFIDTNFQLRFRYSLAVKIDLHQKLTQPSTFYLSLSNEIFLQTTNHRFDQNWLYGGLGYRFNKKFGLELGYLNQFLWSGNRDQINVISSFTF